MQQQELNIGKSLPLPLVFNPWQADHGHCWERWISAADDCQVFMIHDKSICSSRIKSSIISVLCLIDLALQVHHCCQFDFLAHAATRKELMLVIDLTSFSWNIWVSPTIFPTIFLSFFSIIQVIFHVLVYLDKIREGSNNVSISPFSLW